VQHAIPATTPVFLETNAARTETEESSKPAVMSPIGSVSSATAEATTARTAATGGWKIFSHPCPSPFNRPSS